MSKLDIETINSIKVLALDMIDKAGSGHPGIVLGAAPIIYALYKDHLKAIPSNSNWINRDRFVLSAGHGSALLYSLLYHAGYDIDIEELKHFRELNSLTPGHPEYRVTPGVDASTGPLGEGIGMAVGMALAERYLRTISNIEKKNSNLIDYYTYCLCGDGDLMEGVSYEALSFASAQNLNKLIILYDCNHVSLDSDTTNTFTEDIEIRFEALNFNILNVKNGNDYNEISKAIKQAKKSNRPTIIICNTTIGKDSLLEGTNKVHGKPLSKEDLNSIKTKYKITNESFTVSQEVLNYFQNTINTRVGEAYKKWEEEYISIKESDNIGLHSLINLLERNTFVIDFDDTKFKISDEYNEELRESNHKIMNFISPKNPFFLGGSADLSSSCKTNLDKSSIQSEDNPVGKNIYFGVREHAMGAILNGMALSNLKVFVSCLPTLTENDFSVDKLIDILPEDRANQIKDGNLFISSDYKYLYYKGYAYEIYDPYLERNNTTTLSFSRIEEWTIVHTKSYDETTWDWWGAVANLSNMSSDDYAGAMVDNYSNTFNIIDALIGVAKFIEDARNDASVDVVFEQNQYGDRRVVIGITNSTYQEIYNNYAGTSMSVLDNCMDNAAKWRWSKEISNYYSYLTGKTVDMLKYDYDLVITMDEGHRNQKYTSTVSFDEDGTMIESTLILPNDSIKIIQQGSFLGLNEKEIYNVNIKECEEISEQYKTMFLQGLNYGFD